MQSFSRYLRTCTNVYASMIQSALNWRVTSLFGPPEGSDSVHFHINSTSLKYIDGADTIHFSYLILFFIIKGGRAELSNM